ncbi:MAG TPA: anhydro-N-acetylmuramic acid kinase [Gemmatimonadales bacterium]|nr:anhydro-N-acetylmuramic acid kinase [Gemmatimonadales bacterium]
MSEAPSLVVGLMSGTSLDGMDAALVRIDGPTSLELVAFAHRGYDGAERAMLERGLTGGTAAEYAALHAAIGDWAAEAVDAVLATAHVRADALACISFPGQTIWHAPPSVTWQLGDASRLAERFGVRVVHDLRARDVAAGGQGAPLVPLVDALCFGAARGPRVLLNIGGMANATWVPVRGELEGVVAGDSGPGVAIIDAVARLVDPTLPYDVDGALAARGRVDDAVLADLLADPFFAMPLPRSTGRERFGADYAAMLHARVPGVDGVRTAVALTAASIARFVREQLPAAPELVAAGGGTRHPVLMQDLAARLDGTMTVRRFEACFFPAEAKEAAAFALLGWLTIHGQPGNHPQVTGAAGWRVLGSVVPG